MKKYISIAFTLLFLFSSGKAQIIDYSGVYIANSDLTLDGITTQQYTGKLTLTKVDATHYRGTNGTLTMAIEIFPNNGRPLYTSKDVSSAYSSFHAGKFIGSYKYAGWCFKGMFWDPRPGDVTFTFQGSQSPVVCKNDQPVASNPLKYGDVYSVGAVTDSIGPYWLKAPLTFSLSLFHCGQTPMADVSNDPSLAICKWVLVSASGKRPGATVESGDLVYLENQGTPARTYLSVCPESAKTLTPEMNGNLVNIAAATSNKWRIVTHLDRPGTINANELVQFQNADGYGGWLQSSLAVFVNYYRELPPSQFTTTHWKLVR